MGRYKRQARKPKVTREEILVVYGIPSLKSSVLAEERSCPYCNTPMKANEKGRP